MLANTPTPTQPSWWSRLVHLLARNEPRGADFPLSPLESELTDYCRQLGDENARLRAAAGLAATEEAHSVADATAIDLLTTTAEVNWEQAFWSLHSELDSLRRNNEALVSEVQGRKRSQYGSRSEKIRPEELLAAVRSVKETDPHLVQEDLLEELEQVCAEREKNRLRRKEKQQEKRRAAADTAARQAIAKRADKKPNGDDGDDNGGGGGGGGAQKPRTDDSTSVNAGVAQVIPLRRPGHRNACLTGLMPHDMPLKVEGADLLCPICQVERKVIGYQDSDMLDIVLPSLRRLRPRQEKRACAQHPDAGVAMAPAAQRPIAQALPTALLLAFMVVAKVQDHLPLERLSAMFKRWGVRVPPSTLGGWYQAAGELAVLLAEHLGKKILASKECMHTDETSVRVIDPAAPNGSTNASLWGYTVPGVGTYFRYTKDGSYDDTRAKLVVRSGPTMTDGHKGYVSQRVDGSSETIPVINGPHLNCFDHARRPFEEAFRLDGDPRAGLILGRIQSLYRVEAQAKKDQLTPEQVKSLREAKSQPLFDKLFVDLKALHLWVTPKSRLGRAIATTLRRKTHLEAYLSNGAWPISNVLQETQFRSKAIGQHNWLFLGSHEAAPRYAALLTLVRSCVMLDVDPVAYLADVFMRLQERGSAKHLDDLLPAAWKQANGSDVSVRAAA